MRLVSRAAANAAQHFRSPRTPALLPKKLPLLVHPFKMLLMRSLKLCDVPRGLDMPSLTPQAPPRTRPEYGFPRQSRHQSLLPALPTDQTSRSCPCHSIARRSTRDWVMRSGLPAAPPPCPRPIAGSPSCSRAQPKGVAVLDRTPPAQTSLLQWEQGCCRWLQMGCPLMRSR